MSVIDTVGASVGSYAWSGLGSALFIFIIFFIVLLFVGGGSWMLWWKSFNTKVHIFKPLGQVKFSDDELKDIQDSAFRKEIHPLIKQIKFDYLQRKHTHGKDITKRGTAYFAVFMPLKNIKPVPLELRYNDGIYLIQLSRDIFIPVPRPSFVINVGQNVSISVAEQQEWVSWSNLMADRINAKFQDPDSEKKQVLYFVVGIAAMVIIGGFLLWLIYESAKKGMDTKQIMDGFTQAIAKGMPAGGIAPK